MSVERLQDISEEDAFAEGAGPPEDAAQATGGVLTQTCREEFVHLWGMIHGPSSWAENPWVFRIRYDVLRQNVDKLRSVVPMGEG